MMSLKPKQWSVPAILNIVQLEHENSTGTRKRRRAKQFDESALPEVQLLGKDKFRIETFNVIIDHLTAALAHRIDAYRDVRATLQLLLISTIWIQR